MRLIGSRVMLRDFIPSDLDDHIRWHTTQTEWMNWDSPWRGVDDRTSPEEYAEHRLSRLKVIDEKSIRWTFELCTYPSNIHIGWMNCYCIDRFGSYSSKDRGRYALGIDIVPKEFRGQGLGAEAYELFEAYLFDFGITEIYTQTWSGNDRMMKLAEKLDYHIYHIKKHKYTLDGKKYDLITYKKEL